MNDDSLGNADGYIFGESMIKYMEDEDMKNKSLH
jgi:hypothetical protein